MKKTIVFLLLCFSFTFSSMAVETSAKSAVLYEGNSEKILYEKNSREKRPIASTTKIMTALIVAEEGNLDDIVTVQPAQEGIEGTSLYLKAGEKISVKTLLYGLMLKSGNDAAEVLSVYIAGDKEKFVSKMNQKAREIGMEDTNFTNPHGLPDDNHYSTAYDMAILTAYAMKNPVFKKVVSTQKYSAEGRSFKNHNKLLNMSEDFNGVKTGFTKAAGRCLVSSYEKNGMNLITVTLFDPNDWDDHMKFAEYGAENYRIHRICGEKEEVARVPVAGAGEIQIISEKSLNYTCKNGKTIEKEIYLPRFCYGPIKKGQKIGRISVIEDGKEIKSVDLVAKYGVEVVEKENLIEKLLRKIKKDED